MRSSTNSGLTASGLGGVRGDLKRRAVWYWRDWRDGLNRKVPAAILFLFVACLAPAVAFGGLMSQLTGGDIGIVEMIVATAGCGVLYAVFAGQPLTILGGTGPLLVFTGILFGVCKRFGVPFLPVYAWIGLWSGLIVIVLGLTGVSRVISLFTRFTDEIFAGLISLIFIVQAVQSVAATFHEDHTGDDAALLGLILTLGTFGVARSLDRFRHRPYLRRTVRELIADFGPAIAITAMVVSRNLLPRVALPTLNVPVTFSTTSGRPWLVALMDVPGWVPVAAIVPALLVALLVFLDQNITVRIIQAPQNMLRKGAAYHWDLVVVGLLLAVTSLFGLPWLVAATVRSVNHVRALTQDATPGEEGGIATVAENRVSPFVIHALIGLSLLATGVLREVPMAVVYGLFLFMGVTSMRGSEFFERLRLWLTERGQYPEHHYVRRVPNRVMHLFTAAQVACLAALWAVKASAFGILFPVLIALLIPIRGLLARVIEPEHLAALDSTDDDGEDDFTG